MKISDLIKDLKELKKDGDREIVWYGAVFGEELQAEPDLLVMERLTKGQEPGPAPLVIAISAGRNILDR